jgi:hypothetical protein
VTETHVHQVRGRPLRSVAAVALIVALAVLATPAAAAPPAPVEDDYNFLQLGVLTEGIAVELYTSTLGSDDWTREQRRTLKGLRRADAEQERQLGAALGEEAPQEGDFEIVLPRDVLRSKARVLALARNLERLTAGVYTAGAEQALDPGTRLLLARLLAKDVQHLSAIAVMRGAAPITKLPGPAGPERAGAFLDRFLRLPTAPDVPAEEPTTETP